MRRLLRSWPLDQQRAFFERDLGIPLELEEETGKYFPVSNRARDVRDGLVALRATGGRVEFRFEHDGLDRNSTRHEGEAGSRRHIDAAHIEADAVILATGGRRCRRPAAMAPVSIWCARSVTPCIRPIRRSRRSSASPPVHASLSGISLNVRLRAKWQRPRDRSHTADFCSRIAATADRRCSTCRTWRCAAVRPAANAPSLRVRWSDLDREAWLAILRRAWRSGADGGRRARCRRGWRNGCSSKPAFRSIGAPPSCDATERTALVDRLTSYELPWTGDEGFKKAEVTGGGVALDEVDHRTLESRVVPWPVPLRRNPRRVRSDRRPQLRVGVGDRTTCGTAAAGG